MQLVVRFLIDVDHVAGFIVREANVLANFRFEADVVDGVLDGVRCRSDVVVAADDQHPQAGLLRHCRTQRFRHLRVAGLVPRTNVAADSVVHVGIPLEVAANVILECGDKSPLVGDFAGVGFRIFAGCVGINTLEARIETPNGAALIALQFLKPAPSVDSQIRFLDVFRRQPGEVREGLEQLFAARHQ